MQLLVICSLILLACWVGRYYWIPKTECRNIIMSGQTLDNTSRPIGDPRGDPIWGYNRGNNSAVFQFVLFFQVSRFNHSNGFGRSPTFPRALKIANLQTCWFSAKSKFNLLVNAEKIMCRRSYGPFPGF